MNSNWIKFKISEVTKTPIKENFYRLYYNRYWITDGENIFCYKEMSNPFCNTNKNIVEKFLKKHTKGICTDIIQLKCVWLVIDPLDYY